MFCDTYTKRQNNPQRILSGKIFRKWRLTVMDKALVPTKIEECGWSQKHSTRFKNCFCSWPLNDLWPLIVKCHKYICLLLLVPAAKPKMRGGVLYCSATISKKKIGQYDTFGKKSCKARWELMPSGCFQLNPICIVLFIVHCVAYQ